MTECNKIRSAHASYCGVVLPDRIRKLKVPYQKNSSKITLDKNKQTVRYLSP